MQISEAWVGVVFRMGRSTCLCNNRQKCGSITTSPGKTFCRCRPIQRGRVPVRDGEECARGGSCELKSIQNRWGLGCSGKRWTSGLHSAYVATAAGSCAAVAWNLLCPPNTGCYWDSKPPALNQIGISCPISLCVCHAPVGQAFLQQGSASVCCMLISLTSLQGAQPGQPAEVQISRSPVWARF